MPETPIPADNNLSKPLTKGDLLDALTRIELSFANLAEAFAANTNDPHNISTVLLAAMSECRYVFKKVTEELLKR